MAKNKPVPKQLQHIGGLRHAPVTEHEPGVYFLVRRLKVVYVGQSVTPRSRIATHLREGEKQFDDAWIRHCDAKELDTLESMFIHHFQPEYNTSSGPDQKLAPLPISAVRSHIDALVDRLVVADKTATDSLKKASRITYGSLEGGTRRLLRLPDVMHLVGLRKSAIYAHMQAGTFPRCVKFGRSVMWPEEAINKWVDDRLAAPAGIEPAFAP